MKLLKKAMTCAGILAAAGIGETAYFYQRTMKRNNAKVEKTIKMAGTDWSQYAPLLECNGAVRRLRGDQPQHHRGQPLELGDRQRHDQRRGNDIPNAEGGACADGHPRRHAQKELGLPSERREAPPPKRGGAFI